MSESAFVGDSPERTGNATGNTIPHELRQRPQWVTWRFEQINGNRTKVPYQTSGDRASTTTPETWTTFDAAVKASSSFDGIGYVVTAGDGLVGIDLDHCLQDGKPEPWAAEVLNRFTSYTERTPSGDGLRVWVRGIWPCSEHKKPTGRGAVEVYSNKRYFTITGKHVEDTPTTIKENQKALDWLRSRYFPEKAKPDRTHGSVLPPPSLEDAEIIRLAMASKQGPKFSRLWSGSTADHGGDDSAADLALCSMLAFWTRRDPVAVDQLFRQSRLYREKWDSHRGDGTYGSITINKAIASCAEVYEEKHRLRVGEASEGQQRPDPAECPKCGKDSCDGTCGEKPSLITFRLDDFLTHTFAPRRALLFRDNVAVFREGHIGEVYAPRGTGKSWLLSTLALIAATGTESLGFRAPEPCRVLFVDGEMSSEELQGRFRHLCAALKVKSAPGLVLLGADWQAGYLPRLDTSEGQMLLEPFVAEADLIFIDNRSCLFDPEGESDPAAWQPAQDWLLSLRRRGKAVLPAHHSNRLGGARGHSKPEDVMNLLIKLSRPDGYTQDQGCRFLLEFEKTRGFHGLAAAPFVASLTDRGWVVEGTERVEADSAERKLMEWLRVSGDLGEPPTSTGDWVSKAKVGRTEGWKAVKRLLDSGQAVKRDGAFHVS